MPHGKVLRLQLLRYHLHSILDFDNQDLLSNTSLFSVENNKQSLHSCPTFDIAFLHHSHHKPKDHLKDIATWYAQYYAVAFLLEPRKIFFH